MHLLEDHLGGFIFLKKAGSPRSNLYYLLLQVLDHVIHHRYHSCCPAFWAGLNTSSNVGYPLAR
jgi:hypothetical protein